MPNMTVIAPRDYKSLQRSLEYATEKLNGPCAVRYPRGSEAVNTYDEKMDPHAVMTDDYSDITKPYIASDTGSDYCIISVGSIYKEACDACSILEENGIKGKHINLVLVKPVDEDLIRSLVSGCKYVFTIEEGIKAGGVGSYLASCLSEDHDVVSFAVEDPIVRAASQARQRQIAGIDSVSVADKIRKTLGR